LPQVHSFFLLLYWVEPATTAKAAVNASIGNKLFDLNNNTDRDPQAYISSIINVGTKGAEPNDRATDGTNAEPALAIIRRLYPRSSSLVITEQHEKEVVAEETVSAGSTDNSIIQESTQNNEPIQITEPTVTEPAAEEPEATEPLLTIESVTNVFKNFSKKKVSFQFFFTPTVSYRKLTENKSYLRSAPASLSTSYPELYNIKAFNNTTELATIALNNGNNNVALRGARSNYRNFGAGGEADWLQNISFQVSAPVGAEIKVAGSSKGTSFGVATTVQPTYVLGDRAYVLSSDYKNYSEIPWLMRRWNVATSVETFVSYSTGKIKWQVGPQVRYQLLSSFVTEYPVKENLFDFGLKVGISLNGKQEAETNK
jgi:hypothetical protein